MDGRTLLRVAGRVAAGVVALAILTPSSRTLEAQRRRETGRVQRELRLDATVAELNAAHLGIGANIRSGYYVRTGFGLALGGAEGPDGDWVFSQRLEFTGRFLLDPFAERRRGLYAGGGVVVRHDGDANPDARLMLLLGVEGEPRGGRIRSLEVALGGGVRVGVVVRRARPGSER